MKTQPGVMLYFDVRDSIAQLSYEEKGRLLDAILDYGQHRQEPMFDGVALPLIWPFVRKDIHRDSERYEAMRAQRKAAADRRWQRECEPLREDASACESMREDASACETMREIPTTSTPSSPAAAAPSTAAAAAETPSPTPAASSLPRTNGSSLPDIVAQYLPARRNTPEDIERRRAEAIARLRAMPDN